MGSKLNRRNFTRLVASAFGGVMAGSMIGCGGGDDKAGEPVKSKAMQEDLEAAKKEKAEDKKDGEGEGEAKKE